MNCLRVLQRSLLVVFAAASLLFVGCTRSAEDTGAARETAGGASAPEDARVDVILVTIDTLRADALGFAGNPRVETPNLDGLATSGMVFPNAHAHNVVTLPSHVNILTGLHPYEHGVRDNSGFVLSPEIPTLATMLDAQGYATAAFVGAFPLDRRFGLTRGFDVYDDEFPRASDPAEFVVAERRGDEVVRRASSWWRGHEGKQRFLWVHLYDPHAAYDPPSPFRERYRDRPYLGEVAATDAFLGPLLEPFLDGREGPALVVVTADHGEALGDHGEQTHGLFAYEATLKVPLILWGAGIPAGADPRSARHVDLVPTVLDRLGLEAPRPLPGRSLLGAPPQQDTVTYFEALSTFLNRGWAPLRGVLQDGDKLIQLPIPELYRLEQDPQEEQNLAAKQQDRVRRLAHRLPEETPWPPAGRSVDPEEATRLRSLGYLASSAPVKAEYGPEDDPKRLVHVDRMLHEVIDLYSRGRYEETVTAAQRVVAARPDMAEGYDHLALALRQLERHEEAAAALRDGLRNSGGRESLARQLGQTLSEIGRGDEAVAVLEPFAEGGEPETLRALGVALSDAGQHRQALAVLERAEAAAANDPRVLESRGVVLLRLEQPEAARDALRQALAMNERLPFAWNTLGVALYRLEGPEPAIAAWEKAVALDPRQYDALYNLGLVAAATGAHDTARRALERYVATAPPERFAAEIARARDLLQEIPG